MSKDTFPPWINGIYSLMSSVNKVFKVEGENVKLQEFKNGQESDFSEGIWKFGAFGNTQKEVENATGKKNNDVEITLKGGKWKCTGVVCNDGKRITIWDGILKQLDNYEWMSEKDYMLFKDMGDPWDSPSHHYKFQPDNVGKLIWITGAPGTGNPDAPGAGTQGSPGTLFFAILLVHR